MDELRAVDEVPLHRGPTKIQVAVLEPRLERGLRALVVDREGRRRRAREDLEAVDVELDLPRRPLRVHVLRLARDDLAVDRDRELRAELRRVRLLGTEDDLRDAVAIAEVDEVDPAVVPPRRDPAVQRRRLPDVRLADLPAGVGPTPVGACGGHDALCSRALSRIRARRSAASARRRSISSAPSAFPTASRSRARFSASRARSSSISSGFSRPR